MNITTNEQLDELLGTTDPVLSEISRLAWKAWALSFETETSNELRSILKKASRAAVEACSASYKF